eukprot:16963-Heterococcus_DN1.PRE.4
MVVVPPIHYTLVTNTYTWLRLACMLSHVDVKLVVAVGLAFVHARTNSFAAVKKCIYMRVLQQQHQGNARNLTEKICTVLRPHCDNRGGAIHPLYVISRVRFGHAERLLNVFIAANKRRWPHSMMYIALPDTPTHTLLAHCSFASFAALCNSCASKMSHTSATTTIPLLLLLGGLLCQLAATQHCHAVIRMTAPARTYGSSSSSGSSVTFMSVTTWQQRVPASPNVSSLPLIVRECAHIQAAVQHSCQAPMNATRTLITMLHSCDC